jgi:uncharacterized membrane protein
MPSAVRTFFRHSRQFAMFGALSLATLVCVGLLILRVAWSHRPTYIWLLWNLALAWLPVVAAFIAYNWWQRKLGFGRLMIPACGLFWLAFFPNAPYLVTDLIHLQAKPGAPFWYDLILLVAFAWTGFFLGLASLVMMQEIVRRAVGPVTGWIFAILVLGLSSFGIYLGRFLRWNSWDLVFNPLRLLGSAAEPLLHPVAHAQSIAFSVLFAFFLVAMYLTMMAVTHFRREVRDFD